MKPQFSLTFGLLLAASSAFAGENGLFAEIGRLGGLFDGGVRPDVVEVSPSPVMPMPKGGDWQVPGIQGVPVEAWSKNRDVLKETPSCRAVDYHYFRKPSPAEAIGGLSDCLNALSQRYGVSITAAEGKSGIVLMLGGLIPPGSTVKSDLETALQLRDGRLFGVPSALIDLERPASDSQTSSLQPIVDRCGETPRDLPDAAAFVAAFGACVRDAKGISITAMRPDEKDAALVLVYSRDPKHLIREMNGVVRVLTERGVTRLRIQAQSEFLTDGMLETGLGLPIGLPR